MEGTVSIAWSLAGLKVVGEGWGEGWSELRQCPPMEQGQPSEAP